MFERHPTLALLFEQLGLDADEAAIEQFLQNHSLNADVLLHQAPFWNDAQRQFLHSHWEKDDEWSLVIDQLNELLRP
ncbi:DUF2789 family protein [Acinetobacter sp. MD2]|uniref:DUF2789 family protein n=1 Tax=Acinetobacter sp. MD2 TaxID=2600066 RepID=UPI002D1E91F8|nr:DUF2789 family protein [Acinetobacter sp. MD2]MEB3767099.1 DUF2789 domain-containing protein [Acinetobacter sp. MD2]